MNAAVFRRALLAGAGTIVLSSPGFAQDSVQPETDADSSAEIVVTAQNRAENVQDVPIAIQVVSGEEVAKAGIVDLTGIQRLAPAVQVVNDTNLTRVTVRGVGTNDNAETQDQSVAVNVDGEYINRPTVLNAAIFDLERVEVLRGPQGTLYGRNSTGGAINFITRKPRKDLGFNGSVSFGNYDHVLVQGGIDVPIGDVAAIRVAGTYSDRDGYFRHPNLGRDTGDDYTRGGRISLRLEPSDALTINAAVEHVKVNRILAAQAFANFNPGGGGLGFNAAFAPGPGCNQNGFVRIGADPRFVVCIPQNTNILPTIDRDNYLAPARSPSVQDQDTTAVRGRIAYDIGPATITYTGGYRTTDEAFDAALSPAFLFKNFANDVDTQSHELRVNGTTGITEWQAGVFRFREKLDIERGLFNGPPFFPPFLLGANGGYINYFDRRVTTGSWAVFAQTDITLSDTLTAVVGARYTWDKRTAVFNNFGSGIGNPASPLFNTGPVPITTAPISVTRPSADAEKFTWLLGLNYEPDTKTLLYAKVSTGFKAGGFDSIGSYDPETNTAYEAGVKRSLGRGSFVNLSGFYYDYKDLQAAVLLDSSIGGQVFNAGKATIWGLELDAGVTVLRNGRFTVSANYLNSEYKDFLASYAVFCASETHPTLGCLTGLGDLDSDAVSPPITQPNLAGNRPPQSPRWVIAAGYEHRFDLGALGSITPSVFTRYKSSYFLDIFNFRDSRQGSFFQTDASIEWRDADDRFGVTAFVRNIEDNQPLTFAGFTAAGNDDIYNFQFGAPRTYGLRLSMDF